MAAAFYISKSKAKVLISPHPHKHLLSILKSYTSVLVSSTAITRYCRQGGLNNRNFCSHSPRGLKSKIVGPEVLVSQEVSISGLQRATFSRCPHKAFPLSVYMQKERSLVFLPLLIKVTSPILLEPHSYNFI